MNHFSAESATTAATTEQSSSQNQHHSDQQTLLSHQPLDQPQQQPSEPAQQVQPEPGYQKFSQQPEFQYQQFPQQRSHQQGPERAERVQLTSDGEELDLSLVTPEGPPAAAATDPTGATPARVSPAANDPAPVPSPAAHPASAGVPVFDLDAGLAYTANIPAPSACASPATVPLTGAVSPAPATSPSARPSSAVPVFDLDDGLAYVPSTPVPSTSRVSFADASESSGAHAAGTAQTPAYHHTVHGTSHQEWGTRAFIIFHLLGHPSLLFMNLDPKG